MRKWFRRFLLLALIALPSAAQAQYPAGYYWQPGYPAPYPNYPQAPYVAPAHYYQAPAQYYQAPVRPVVPPAMSPFASRASDWDSPVAPVMPVQPVRQVQAVMPVQAVTPVQPVGQPAVLPAIGTVKGSSAGDAQVRPVAKSSLPASDEVPTPAAAPKKDPVGEPSLDRATAPVKQPREVVLPTAKTPAAELPASDAVQTPSAAPKKNPVGEPGFVEKVTTPVKQPREVVFPIAKTPATETPVPAPAPIEISEQANCRDKRLVVFADYLLWNVHGADVPFSQPFDGILPALSVPRGPVGVVSPDFKSGFRVGGGVDNPGGVSVFGTFTYFFTERSADIAAGDGLVLHNFLAFPNTFNSAVDSLSASANYKIRLLMADIDVKCDIVNNDCFRLNWLAGVRYAHNDQDVFSTFQVTGTTTVDSRINFDAFGPRFGLEGKYRTRSGLYGYASGIVDVLLGQYRGSYEERNVFTGLVGLTSITANRVVPVLELELGGGWESQSGRVRVSGGYYVGSWFNTMTTTSFASAIGNTNFTTNGNNFRDNLVFDGLVVRFEFRY